MFTIVKTCNYIELDNFYANTDFDIELFYFELSKIEKRRIFNFLFKIAEKSIKNKKIFVLSYLGICFLLPLLYVRLSSSSHTSNSTHEAPFAVITSSTYFPSTSSQTSNSNSAAESAYTATSVARVRQAHSSISIPQHSNFKSDLNKTEEKYISQKIFKKEFSRDEPNKKYVVFFIIKGC